MIQWRCQWSAFHGWPSHSMCSRPHFTGKPDWPRADFAENCLLRAGSKASAVSRFREKLSPANGVQGITTITRKIALLGVMSTKLAKWVAKKWGPRRDRDVSDSAIYTTAIYRAYTVITIYSVTESRILTFILQIMTTTNPTQIKFPPGTSTISEELNVICGQYFRIVAHNRNVFGNYYGEIIQGLLKRTQGARSPRLSWEPPRQRLLLVIWLVFIYI